ncbi:hypothetical protein H2198_006277 [Neophaeococcomyces mojaviensis]|uniref:Uncharacterized protein n=1 Tax=Neophaeococcomyces mojaviensis TaxID=3383035 RepID=A0ACC3A377_9EURO|nr:hypothetical protein H2198_006277 [Knufia sp. JES_112]
MSQCRICALSKLSRQVLSSWFAVHDFEAPTNNYISTPTHHYEIDTSTYHYYIDISSHHYYISTSAYHYYISTSTHYYSALYNSKAPHNNIILIKHYL